MPEESEPKAEDLKQELEIVFKTGLKGLFLALSVILLIIGLVFEGSTWWEWPLVICVMGFCIFMVLDRR